LKYINTAIYFLNYYDEKAGKPTITYGEYLNSMEVSTVPTNAEVNDLINTVMDGTDCIYLDVTMRSENKTHCLQYASSLCRQGEATIWEQQLFTELNKKVWQRKS